MGPKKNTIISCQGEISKQIKTHGNPTFLFSDTQINDCICKLYSNLLHHTPLGYKSMQL